MTEGSRDCPFVVGRPYRVLKTFKALRDAFTEGEQLTFVRYGHSWYDGIAGYFFTDATGEHRVWDVDDRDDLGVHRDLFEKLAP